MMDVSPWGLIKSWPRQVTVPAEELQELKDFEAKVHCKKAWKHLETETVGVALFSQNYEVTAFIIFCKLDRFHRHFAQVQDPLDGIVGPLSAVEALELTTD